MPINYEINYCECDKFQLRLFIIYHAFLGCVANKQPKIIYPVRKFSHHVFHISKSRLAQYEKKEGEKNAESTCCRLANSFPGAGLSTEHALAEARASAHSIPARTSLK